MDKLTTNIAECPVCSKQFKNDVIEAHVNRCIFLNSRDEQPAITEVNNKRNFHIFERSPSELKKPKFSRIDRKMDMSVIKSSDTNLNVGKIDPIELSDEEDKTIGSTSSHIPSTSNRTFFQKSTKFTPKISDKIIPLAEKMRPNSIAEFVGQEHVIGTDTILRKVLNKNDVPSMIFWGPPGCGKTTLAHIIAAQCKNTENARFVKLSATMVGVNDVKEVVKVAKNEQKFNRKTILFMDEIHRFNKIQQDIFLPHVENGTITLIGATTENPSFSLNSALLSRCRVIVLQKLDAENMYKILDRSLSKFNAIVLDKNDEPPPMEKCDFIPSVVVEKASLMWLAEICDGDARIALNSLELAMQSIIDSDQCSQTYSFKHVTLAAIKDGIKKSHLLYDRKGDQHYDIISALHKSIRASDDNAALYWCTRMIMGGEDPRYICRRMIRAASEDIGLADPQAISVALSALEAVKFVGMPESDVIIAQCAIYLARAPKSTEAYLALSRCKKDITDWKGPLPSVPLHLRNAPTKLMKDLGYGNGYNMLQRDDSGLNYMPGGMEERNYFD